MKFVKNGPDVPDRLLQAHEDGHVVFFCGAGISYLAGLPDFSGLVTKLYDLLAPTPTAVQRAAIKAKQFDTAIGLLEAQVAGGREKVRRELAAILAPDLASPNATATHEAMLTLAKTRDGRTRLITTNFDRIFEEVIATKALTVKRFHAPLLPVPKNRWDGLVYLHGLISAAPAASNLDQLVISSGDFGLAYLNERWAARFLSELFRNSIVCFVGYSINDPVLRYMMDALAADRLRGESPSEVFAFGSYTKNKQDQYASEWLAKNVTPILYIERNYHAYLHRTLRAWADTYRDGVSGKERIIVQDAAAKPQTGTRQDDFIGRVLWALSDSSGLPAKRFAEMDPVPPLDWLGPLSENRYRYIDLGRFGIQPQTIVDEKLKFSVTRRPAPYTFTAWMALVDGGRASTGWDNVMYHLARWLLRHLNDERLVLRLANQGGQLNPGFSQLIESRLDELTKLEQSDNQAELSKIRDSAPNAIPSPFVRTLWRLFLTGRVKSSFPGVDLYHWMTRLKRDGLTASLRLELRDALSPQVSLREPISWPTHDGAEHKAIRIKDLVDWEITLSADQIHPVLRDALKGELWTDVLPELLSDFTALLRDALDLMRELGGANDKSDVSFVHQPSIAEHPQNKGFHNWTILIDLTRDAWLATAKQSPETAALIAESWWHIRYPLFRRLCFFAALPNNLVICHHHALDWLLSEDNWWLWSAETEREAMRLMVSLAPHLENPMLRRLEQAIIAGPPRDMFKADLESDKWARIVDRDIWLRLAKLEQAGGALSSSCRDRLRALSSKYPEWELMRDERDEFPIWSGEGDEWRKFEVTPRSRRELIQWLKKHPEKGFLQDDDWRQRCSKDFATTACALCALAKEGFWPKDRWIDALQAWSEEKLQKRSWRYMAPIVSGIPNELFRPVGYAVSWWLQAIAKTFDGHEAIFFAIGNRILAFDSQSGVSTDDPVTQAFNHPVGHVAQALLNWWFRQSLADGQGLPDKLRSIFTELCDTKIERFRHGRALLAAHTVTLFRVDKAWTTQHLLPLFDWQRSKEEARAAWAGFLWSPRLYRPLMEVLKPAFLETARNYISLGKDGSQFASLLTFAALDRGDTFTVHELRDATAALPADGLRQTAQALSQGLQGSANQSQDYWSNRIVPYLKLIWPKTRTTAVPVVASGCARLCIAAHENFPTALELLRPWLAQPTDPYFLIHLLNESGLCKRFPSDTLEFLDIVAANQSNWLPNELKLCLHDIRLADAGLVSDSRFQRLVTEIRKRGEEWT